MSEITMRHYTWEVLMRPGKSEHEPQTSLETQNVLPSTRPSEQVLRHHRQSQVTILQTHRDPPPRSLQNRTRKPPAGPLPDTPIRDIVRSLDATRHEWKGIEGKAPVDYTAISRKRNCCKPPPPRPRLATPLTTVPSSSARTASHPQNPLPTSPPSPSPA